MKIDELAPLLLAKRGSMGIRSAAAEMNISPATLSRVERGHIPDMQTLDKICAWLGENPETFADLSKIQIVFKKNATLKPETSQALARLISIAHSKFLEELKSSS
jgi:transcriptional regulator with XRE-family HTH domain